MLGVWGGTEALNTALYYKIIDIEDTWNTQTLGSVAKDDRFGYTCVTKCQHKTNYFIFIPVCVRVFVAIFLVPSSTSSKAR